MQGVAMLHDLCPAKGREAIHDGDADLNFDGLAVGGSCRDPLAKELQAVHHSFDPTSDMLAGPCHLDPRPRCRVVRRISFR